MAKKQTNTVARSSAVPAKSIVVNEDKNNFYKAINITSSRIINIGDLPNIPSFQPGECRDLLRYYSLEQIEQSKVLTYLVNVKWLKVDKKIDGTSGLSNVSITEINNQVVNVVSGVVEEAIIAQSASPFVAPRITKIDAQKGIVYFDNPSNEQVEIYKYTRKRNGKHHSKKNEYSPRLGKRYKVLYQLKNGAEKWEVPERWIYPANKKGQGNLRNYFKLGVRSPDGKRSDLSVLTVATAVQDEYSKGTRIILENSGGNGKKITNPESDQKGKT